MTRRLTPEDREAITLIPCGACGGAYERIDEEGARYRVTRCRWCTRGAQDREQLRAWQEHRAKGGNHDRR